jgi:hypothetical protein
VPKELTFLESDAKELDIIDKWESMLCNKDQDVPASAGTSHIVLLYVSSSWAPRCMTML